MEASKEEQSFGDDIKKILVNTLVFIVAYLFAIIPLFFLVWIFSNGLDNTLAISIAGITWLVIWMVFLSTRKEVLGKVSKEISESNKEKEKGYKFDWVVNKINIYFLDFKFQWLYKLMAVSIVSTHVFIEVTLAIGGDDLGGHMIIDELLDYLFSKNWGIGDFVFILCPFLLAFFKYKNTDLKDEILNPDLASMGLVALVVVKYYTSIIVFITGMIGGQEAFIAVNHLKDLNPVESFDLFRVNVNELYHTPYEKTYIFIIYDNLKSLWFFVFYCVIPYLVIRAYRSVKKDAKGAGVDLTSIRKIKNAKTLLPAMYFAYAISLVMIFLFIFISWHEGLIVEGIAFIIESVGAISDFLKGIFG